MNTQKYVIDAQVALVMSYLESGHINLAQDAIIKLVRLTRM